jgi:hypothetical protein
MSRPMRTILVTRDDRLSREIEPALIETATVEVLRACAFAADVVLIPAIPGLLPFAAVIAHDLRQAAPAADDRLRFPAGRFVPIAREPAGAVESLRPFLRADLGGPTVDPVRGHHVLTVAEAVAEHPPNIVVALTFDELAVGLLRSLERKPPVWYFQSLLGDHADTLTKQFGPLASRLVDLEQRMRSVDDHDPESRRSDSEGLERFVPFGVLLQEALWPEEPRPR